MSPTKNGSCAAIWTGTRGSGGGFAASFWRLAKSELEGNFLANYRATSELGRYLLEGNSPAKSTKLADRIKNTEYREDRAYTKRELGEGVLRGPLPQNWSPMKEGQEGAAELSPIDRFELEKFRDRHSGRGTVSADWPAEWRNWQRTEFYGRGYKEQSVNNPEDLEARRNAIEKKYMLKLLVVVMEDLQ